MLNFQQLHVQLTGVCSLVLRNILCLSAPVVAAVSFMDICFALGWLFPGGNHFPTCQSYLSANWGCVIFSVKHFEIHQCKKLVKVGYEFFPCLPAVFIQVLPLLIFCIRGHTELDSNQGKFSIGCTDFLLNYYSITFLWE